MHSRIIIIGLGPAGIACAIQLRRMGLQPLVIERNKTGGLIVNANRVENYLGFPHGISGTEFVKILEDQVEKYKLKILRDEIEHAEFSGRLFHLAGKSNQYSGDILVIATGTEPVIPEICTSDLINSGLVFTDISALLSMSGKTIGIIGAGDAAFDYAASMRDRDNEVLIFNRGDRVKALRKLQEDVFQSECIRYYSNTRIRAIELLPSQNQLRLIAENRKKHEFVLDYLIFATGRKPALKFLSQGLISQLEPLRAQNRLYLIGDVKNEQFRQVSIAAGDGIKAAMEIFRHGSNQENR